MTSVINNKNFLSFSAQVGVSMVARSINVGLAPVEDMQALSITTLSASEVEQQYELIGPLGKGTYGRVDLVAHRTQGKWVWCLKPQHATVFLRNKI